MRRLETTEQRAINFAVSTHDMFGIFGSYDSKYLMASLQLLAEICEWLVYDEVTLRKISGD